ncbi:MAG: DUF21 domain-containing protein [Mycoplasmataceae bacterium]|nr:DUF21 domain-containing protein [Mycoplasmataceae bacterium]
MNIVFPITILILIILSAFFSFSEIALASLNKHKLTAKKVNSTKNHQIRQINRALYLHDRYNESSSSIVIANNIVNILTTTLATVWFSAIFKGGGATGPIIAFLFTTVLIIIFGEIIPKMLAKRFPEQGILIFSAPLILNLFLTKPVSYFLAKLVSHDDDEVVANEQEFHQLIDETNDDVITRSEQELIRGAMLLDQTESKKRMVPIKNMISFTPKEATQRNVDKLIKKYQYTRIPVFDEKGLPLGILNTKQYLIQCKTKKTIKILDLVYEIPIFDENILMHEVFSILRKNRQHMALLKNVSNGKITGLITIEDIVETIVGDIYDETDIEADGVYKISESSYLVKPNVKIGYLFSMYFKKIYIGSEIKRLSTKEFVDKIAGKNAVIDDYITFKSIIIWVKEDKYEKNKLIYEFELIN